MKSNVLLLLVLLFVGAANAAPTEVEERVAYTSSLNAMVAVVMNWYDSLVDSNQIILFDKSQSKWNDYRSLYPNKINYIELTSTDLIKLSDNNEYQFTTQVSVFYHDGDGQMHQQQLSERFVFNVPLLAKPSIKTITRESIEETGVVEQKFEQLYFKVRQFSYAWLAYLDGVSTMTEFMNADNWIKTAPYSLKIGSFSVTNLVPEVLQQRQQFLANGGHKLRSLDVKPNPEQNNIKLDLIIEWQGENSKGKPTIAKIHQQIVLNHTKGNAWEVLSIKEDHLLPDLKPWQGFLC